MNAQQEQESDISGINQVEALQDLLVREMPKLRKSVASRIWRKGLATDPTQVTDLTDEVLQEVAKRALAQAHKYNPTLRGYARLCVARRN